LSLQKCDENATHARLKGMSAILQTVRTSSVDATHWRRAKADKARPLATQSSLAVASSCDGDHRPANRAVRRTKRSSESVADNHSSESTGTTRSFDASRLATRSAVATAIAVEPTGCPDGGVLDHPSAEAGGRWEMPSRSAPEPIPPTRGP